MRPLHTPTALAGFLVVGSSISANAQTFTRPAASWYGAVEASYHQFAQPETVHPDGTPLPYQLHPVQVLVGYRFTNGFNLEGLFMQHQRAAVANSNRVFTSPDRYYYYSNEAVRNFAVTLLLRGPIRRYLLQNQLY